MTEIEMIRLRLLAIEYNLSRALPADQSIRFESQIGGILLKFNKNDVKEVPFKPEYEVNYKAKYQRLVEIEKAHQEHISKLVAENNRLNEALKKWGIYGER